MLPLLEIQTDFFPTRTAYFSHEVEKGNAAAHTLMNVHNSLWYSQIVWPDFDMFQTHHRSAAYHAVTRVISGGPLYITDEAGKQNFEILRKLTYRDGQILRADIPGRPTRDCLFQINELKPFKAFTLSGHGGLLAAYNAVDADTVFGSFSVSDVDGLKGESFAIYEHFSGQFLIASKGDDIPLALARLRCKLFSIVPIVENRVALIGLVDKYNSPKTILKQEISSNVVSLTLKEEGKLIAYLNQRPIEVKVNGVTLNSVFWNYQGKLLSIDVPKKVETLDEIILSISL